MRLHTLHIPKATNALQQRSLSLINYNKMLKLYESQFYSTKNYHLVFKFFS